MTEFFKVSNFLFGVQILYIQLDSKVTINSASQLKLLN